MSKRQQENRVPRSKRVVEDRRTASADGFINVAVTATTRADLNRLKEVMGVRSQADVIEKLVAIGVAIHRATS